MLAHACAVAFFTATKPNTTKYIDYAFFFRMFDVVLHTVFCEEKDEYSTVVQDKRMKEQVGGVSQRLNASYVCYKCC